jgi:hypothetical protein
MCRKDGGCCGRGSRPKGRASRRPLRPPSAEPARWATLFRDEPTTNRLGEQMGTSRGCVPTSSARIRVVAPRATVKHSRRRHSAAGRAARARPASARSRAVAVECADELVCDLARQQRCMRSAPQNENTLDGCACWEKRARDPSSGPACSRLSPPLVRRSEASAIEPKSTRRAGPEYWRTSARSSCRVSGDSGLTACECPLTGVIDSPDAVYARGARGAR